MLFNRKYQLDFGKPIEVKRTYVTPEVVDIGKLVDSKSPTNAYRLTEHNISFNIRKSVTDSPNSGSITIYNMPKEILGYLENLNGKPLGAILSAGYESGIKEIFKGTVESYTYTFNSPDSILELSLGDGSVNMRETVSVRSYPLGTPYKTIVEDIVGDMGLPKAGGLLNVPEMVTKSDFYAAGSSCEQLRRIAKITNSDFSVQEGAVCWMPKDKGTRQEIIKLTAQSGLLEIAPLNKSEGTNPEDKTSPKKSVRIKCLLNGAIMPNQTVYVESSDGFYKGGYKVTSVVHSGTLEGGEWVTNMEADEVVVYV